MNTATQEQKSIGGSLSTGKTATGVSLNNIGLQLGNTGQEFESKTLATIGQGAVVTSDTSTGKDSLAGVNRDAFNTETIITDRQTGGLAVDTGIDTRVFTSAGRDEIIDEQKGLHKNVERMGKDIAGAAALGYETGRDVYNAIQIAQEIDKLRDTLTPAEQVIFDNELQRLQVENSLESNAVPKQKVVLPILLGGAEAAAAGGAAVAGAACVAVNCPEKLVNGVSEAVDSTGKALAAVIIAQKMINAYAVDKVVGIFKSDDSPKTGNDRLDEVLEDAVPSDEGTKGYELPGTQEELIENISNIEGAVVDDKGNGVVIITLPDKTKVQTYPARSSTNRPGWSITKPNKKNPDIKGDTAN